ncbi:MAG TPA: AAA family ATPase [Planctomycetota bacterium]
MKLTRLHIRKIPGIDAPFTVSFGTGLNLVSGPNASGKTSLTRAFQGVLWPDTVPGTGVDIDAAWTDQDAELRTERSGRRVRWQRDGCDAAAPHLPGRQLAPCYVLGARDLLQDKSATDLGLAREIRRQMAGGFDVQRIAQEHFTIARDHGREVKSALEERRDSLTAVRSDFRQLSMEEDQNLVELLRVQSTAQEAQAMLPDLQVAVELAESRRELDSAESALRGFPSGMDQLQGDELDRLAEIGQDLARQKAALGEWEAAIQGAQDARRKNALPEGPIPGPELQASEARARRLRDLENEVRTRREEVDNRRAAADRAQKELAGQNPRTNLDIELPALEKLDQYLSRAESTRQHKASLQGSLDLLPRSEHLKNEEALDIGANALRDWLAAAGRMPWWQRRLAVALFGCAGAGAGVAAGMFLPLQELQTTLAPIAGALAFATLPMIIGGVSKDQRYYAKDAFEKSKLDAPSEWSRNAVRDRLSELEVALAEIELAKKHEERRQYLNERLNEITKEEVELRGQRKALCDATGVDLKDNDLGLVDIARRVKTWREAATALAESEARLKTGEERCASLQNEVAQFLERHGFPDSHDADQAAARLEELKERSRALREAESDEEDGRRQLERTHERTRELEKRITTVYTTAKLRDRDQDEMRHRLRRLPEYRNWRHEVDRLRGQARAYQAKLSSHPELQNLGLDEVKRREAETRDLAGRLATTSGDIGKIQERIGQARQGHRLEEALAAMRETQEGLGEAREVALLCEAGRFLLQDVEQEFEQESRPSVLRRAMKLFHEFTRGQYLLRFVEGDPPEFQAMEVGTGRPHSLAELSDGVRVQLLLAVRLAFASEAAGGFELPLFLDDALALADVDTFRAVSEAVLALVAGGRQVFYMSARPEGLEHLKALCLEWGIEAPTTVDLTKARELSERRSRPDAA